MLLRAAERVVPRLGMLALLAASCLAAAYALGEGGLSLALGTAGGTLLVLAGMISAMVWWYRARNRQSQRAVAEFVQHDAVPCFVTDADGEISHANPAAGKRFDAGAQTLARVFEEVFANPSAVIFRLMKRAETAGAAREDVVTRRGHVRLATHRVGPAVFLWRIEETAEKGQGRGGNGATLPALTVGRNNAVLFMNAAAQRLIGERVKSLDRLFTTLPVQSGEIQQISTKDGIRRVIAAEIRGSVGRSELYLVPAPEAVKQHDGADRTEADDARHMETLPVPLLKLAADGTVLFMNEQARDLLGSAAREGQHLSALLEGLGRSITDWLTEVAEGREVTNNEFLRVSQRDREVFVQVLLKRVNAPGDTGLIAVLNDATELKTLEAKFVQSQKMQAIGQLAGGVAHDFNNLLTAISGHCDLLLLRHDQSDPDYSDLVQINQNANRAAALVGQLLAFSRKQTLQPRLLDLRETLSDLTHLLNRLVGEKVVLTLEHDPVVHKLRADKRQLEQVLMNIVVNARDAMPDGGEIRIETQGLDLAEPMTRNRAVVPAGKYVCIRIHDDGVGMPPDILQKIFEPFYTTKRTGEGTGLGLSTAYGIIKQSGGFIFADSTPGQGTVFSVILPIHDEDELREPAKPAEGGLPMAAPAGDGVILLVEDEAPVRSFASRALRLRGYTVLEAESAEDALRTLEETDLDIDVFVTDVVMPGMDGPSWVRRALETHPGVRVVFVSGYPEDAFAEGQPGIPNSVFLPKPFSLTELTEVVQRQLH
ncbi:ATP-binding protein [Aquicoccus sp.]|uniref:ATP-binding response regulator n=1 Tax=Aquicoccus sp. TaxID=2055851 RepID=UPI0035670D6C